MRLKNIARALSAVILLVLSANENAFSQKYKWWNERHNWDGVTSWREYIITSPAFMGPNALPVPLMQHGTIAQKAYLKMSAEGHFSKGDNTQNIHTELFIPLFSKRVGLQLQLVPFENYQMDTATIYERRTRNINGKGWAAGDLYFGTYIQLIQEHPKLPDVLLGLHCKTASGSNLFDARFTDAPGYYFDITAGKKYKLGAHQKISWRPYIMTGFYVWQLRGSYPPQNDALLYGGGCDFIFPAFEVKNSLAGYFGYLNIGDRPIVQRCILRTTRDKTLNYEFAIQQGWHDFDYTSIRFSCISDLSWLKKSDQ